MAKRSACSDCSRKPPIGITPGVVDQHVDVAPPVDARLVQKRREGVPVGDVEGVAEGPTSLLSSATADSASATSRSLMTTRAPRASSVFAVA